MYKDTRFDMHINFRHEAHEELEKWTLENTDTLVNILKLARPRVGIFCQSPECAPNNPSNETIFPTFTCNFFAKDFTEAQSKFEKVASMIKENPTLRDCYLRGRTEGQIPFIVYQTDKNSFKCLLSKLPIIHLKAIGTNDSKEEVLVLDEQFKNRIRHLPQKVTDDQYYDGHIHLELSLIHI
eukprot:TRINITY_DN9369_c0_g1_i2.p1 TRINITY_DN9369_c0_g1~~TRINITY_DN9369_c0_g1_i2.p1  ORF type:complete len:196 (-),score=23.39 TRINITY_DN9369_c0_g1_i2:22-567(-)